MENIEQVPSILKKMSQPNMSSYIQQKMANKKSRKRKGIFLKATETEEEEKKDYFSDVLKEQRKKNIVKRFVSKLKQITVRRSVPETESFEYFYEEKGKKDSSKPFKIKKELQIALNLLIILQVVLYFIFSSLASTFAEVNYSIISTIISSICLAIQIIQMVTNAFFISSLKITNDIQCNDIFQMGLRYLKSGFWLDFIIFFIFILDISTVLREVPALRLVFMFLKTKSVLERVSLLEIVLIKNYFKEQYWEVAKLFIFNYMVAHVVSLILLLIAQNQEKDNWLKAKELIELPWFEKYVWAYYWAINIMFTVGFGDLSATTTVQAGCLIFIQTLSCIFLAFNINNLGIIIKKINSYEEDKCKHVKTFARMDEKTDLSQDLKMKMNGFIRESANMKRQYNIEEEELLLSSLPESILDEYRKQTNTKIFGGINFFKHFNKKSLQEIALIIERKLTHPEEIVLHYKKVPNIVLVSGGEFSLRANMVGSQLHGKKMQAIKIGKNQFKLLSLNFIFNKILNYDIKCEDYSVVYQIHRDKFCELIQNNSYNYQYYCMIKDKDKYQQNEQFKCSVCSQNKDHTVFQCPQLHFIPLRQHVMNKCNKKPSTQQEQKKNKIKIDKKVLKNINKPQIHPLMYFAEWNKMLTNESIEIFEEEGSSKLAQKSRKHLKTSRGQEKRQSMRQSTLYLNLKKDIATEISKMQMAISERNFFEWEVECDKGFDYQHNLQPKRSGKEIITQEIQKMDYLLIILLSFIFQFVYVLFE